MLQMGQVRHTTHGSDRGSCRFAGGARGFEAVARQFNLSTRVTLLRTNGPDLSRCVGLRILFRSSAPTVIVRVRTSQARSFADG